MTCPNCDIATDAGERHCANCGYALGELRQDEQSSYRSESSKGDLWSDLAGVLVGVFAARVIYPAILAFGYAAFGSIGAPPPNTELGLAKGVAVFVAVVTIVLAISLVAFFILQPRMNSFARAFVLTVAFLLLGGFLVCDLLGFPIL